MAAYFIDLDGTLFFYDTNTPLPNAIENVIALRRAGHQIIFTTYRSFSGDVREVLDGFGLHDCPILTNIQSPRVVINDEGAKAINRKTDSPWPPPPRI